jgi:hypothetical protein
LGNRGDVCFFDKSERWMRDQNPPFGFAQDDKLDGGQEPHFSRKERARNGAPGHTIRSYFAWAMAWRTWPFVLFNAAWAWGRVAPAASITTATGVLLPEAFKAWVADS